MTQKMFGVGKNDTAARLKGGPGGKTLSRQAPGFSKWLDDLTGGQFVFRNFPRR